MQKQIIGLNAWARKFITNAKQDEDNPNCKTYIFPDGKQYSEFVQIEMIFGETSIFLALKDEKQNTVQESLWDDNDFGC